MMHRLTTTNAVAGTGDDPVCNRLDEERALSNVLRKQLRESSMSAQQVASQRMRRLAEQPHTDVLEYTYEEPEREATAVTAVKMARRTVEARAALPGICGLKRAAKLVTSQDPLLAQFAKTHPQIFMQMLDPEHSGAAMQMLEKLARVRMAVEAREMTAPEAEVHASRLMMEATMRAPRNDTEAEQVHATAPDASD